MATVCHVTRTWDDGEVETFTAPYGSGFNARGNQEYLDPQYVAEKLVPRGLLPHPDDLETLTDLTRLVLGRGAS